MTKNQISQAVDEAISLAESRIDLYSIALFNNDKRLNDLISQNKNTVNLFEKVSSAELYFVGGGDSGGFEESTLYARNGNQLTGEEKSNLEQLAIRIGDGIYDSIGEDYHNNDGGFGYVTMTFNPDNDQDNPFNISVSTKFYSNEYQEENQIKEYPSEETLAFAKKIAKYADIESINKSIEAELTDHELSEKVSALLFNLVENEVNLQDGNLIFNLDCLDKNSNKYPVLKEIFENTLPIDELSLKVVYHGEWAHPDISLCLESDNMLNGVSKTFDLSPSALKPIVDEFTYDDDYFCRDEYEIRFKIQEENGCKTIKLTTTINNIIQVLVSNEYPNEKSFDYTDVLRLIKLGKKPKSLMQMDSSLPIDFDHNDPINSRLLDGLHFSIYTETSAGYNHRMDTSFSRQIEIMEKRIYNDLSQEIQISHPYFSDQKMSKSEQDLLPEMIETKIAQKSRQLAFDLAYWILILSSVSSCGASRQLVEDVINNKTSLKRETVSGNQSKVFESFLPKNSLIGRSSYFTWSFSNCDGTVLLHQLVNDGARIKQPVPVLDDDGFMHHLSGDQIKKLVSLLDHQYINEINKSFLSIDALDRAEQRISTINPGSGETKKSAETVSI